MNLTARRILAKYFPYIFFGVIVLLYIFMVNLKDENKYSNWKYGYTVDFPDGWIREQIKPTVVTLRSYRLQPVTQAPEAMISVVVDQRYGELDLSGHFNILVRDLVRTGMRIMQQGVAQVGTENALWVEFADPNGLERHVWYVFFNRTNRLMIIQYRVATHLITEYRKTFDKFLGSFKLR